MLTVREHLITRHCNPDLYGDSLVINESERVATFLLWNLSGQLIGYQQYRPDNTEKAVKNDPDKRYYLFVGEEGEYFIKSKKKLAIFGLETLKLFPTGPIILTEGIFNATRFHKSGFCALGLLSNDPKRVRNFLGMIHRKKIAVCDGDLAGKKLAKYGDHSINLPDGSDANDLPEDKYIELINKIREHDRHSNDIRPEQGEVLPRSS